MVLVLRVRPSLHRTGAGPGGREAVCPLHACLPAAYTAWRGLADGLLVPVAFLPPPSPPPPRFPRAHPPGAASARAHWRAGRAPGLERLRESEQNARRLGEEMWKGQVGVQEWRRPETRRLFHNPARGCPWEWASRPRMSPEFQVISRYGFLVLRPGASGSQRQVWEEGGGLSSSGAGGPLFSLVFFMAVLENSLQHREE